MGLERNRGIWSVSVPWVPWEREQDDNTETGSNLEKEGNGVGLFARLVLSWCCPGAVLFLELGQLRTSLPNATARLLAVVRLIDISQSDYATKPEQRR